MKKLFTIAAVAAFVSGCCGGEGPAKSKHSDKRYYPIKICSIGDMTGESCIEYAAESYSGCCGGLFTVRTLDGHEYQFNKTGWSVIITKE